MDLQDPRGAGWSSPWPFLRPSPTARLPSRSSCSTTTTASFRCEHTTPIPASNPSSLSVRQFETQEPRHSIYSAVPPQSAGTSAVGCAVRRNAILFIPPLTPAFSESGIYCSMDLKIHWWISKKWHKKELHRNMADASSSDPATADQPA